MSNSFTQTENHENLAADAGQWEAEQAMLADAAREQAREEGREAMEEAARDADESRGWPGDGSGEDDFADFNAMEADDYRDE